MYHTLAHHATQKHIACSAYRDYYTDTFWIVGLDMAEKKTGQGTLSEPRTPDADVEMLDRAKKARQEQDTDTVSLINLSMRRAICYIPNPHGDGNIKVTCKPFEITPEIPRRIALRIMRRPISVSQVYQEQLYTWALMPSAGTTISSFVDKESKQSYDTCRGLGSRNNGTMQEGLYHSVHQAQQLVARFRSAAAVKRYTKEFDRRPLVVQYAIDVLSARMMSNVTPETAVNVGPLPAVN